jgi:hypothetical protein
MEVSGQLHAPVTLLPMNDNAIELKYIDLKSSAVRRFQKINNFLKMAKEGRNI